MYKLFWDPGSANMAPHAVLEEIGCPYELVKVDIKSGEHRQPSYLKLNPNARVPTLVDGDRVMYESAAIILYLVEQHPGAKLAPAPGTRERMLFLQWLMYLTNTIQDSFILYYHPDNFFPDGERRAALKAVWWPAGWPLISQTRSTPSPPVSSRHLATTSSLPGLRVTWAPIFRASSRRIGL